MSKPLSKLELYQFSLTGSSATTIPAQRAAIARCGLSGMTRAMVRRARQAAFKAFRARPENQDIAHLPAWIAAARFEASGDDWLHVSPIQAGRPESCNLFGRLAHDCRDWGRLRKHSYGDGTAFPPRVREDDNGKSGWDRVVWRYADYLSVVSPDRTHIAVQVEPGKPIEIHAIWRGRFLFRGVRCTLAKHTPARQTLPTQKQYARAIRRFLPPGYIVTVDASASGGSLEHTSRGLPVITDLRTGESCHCQLGKFPSQTIQAALDTFRKRYAEKRIAARNADLDRLIQESPERIFVSLEDSLTSGNCEPMSRQFRDMLIAKLGAIGDLGAVRADVILSVRNDDYTRRACRVAALRVLSAN